MRARRLALRGAACRAHASVDDVAAHRRVAEPHDELGEALKVERVRVHRRAQRVEVLDEGGHLPVHRQADVVQREERCAAVEADAVERMERLVKAEADLQERERICREQLVLRMKLSSRSRDQLFAQAFSRLELT